jgi:DNA-binding NarL/FixJ family response regulator
MTKVLIVDDHEVILDGIKAVLNKHEGIEIVGVASDGRDALQKAQSLQPEIVIMDISMPHFHGIEATYQIKKLDPRTKVIIFTMYSYQEFLVDLMKAGISGYVLKNNPISDLHLAIEVVKRGGTFLSKDASNFWAKHANELTNGKKAKVPSDLLSLREREVFQLLADGLSIKEAAGILNISTKTVETHKYHIMNKLQIRTMAELCKRSHQKRNHTS